MEGAYIPEFQAFPKIPRLSRECVITEKLDGTNAQIFIEDDGQTMHCGSRNRWIKAGDDNYGFASWAEANKQQLLRLGPGHHYGEWWGRGIQHGYGGMKDRRFSLFNTSRWGDELTRPLCCDVVPVLYQGPFSTEKVEEVLQTMRVLGSLAVQGFMKPEGIIIYHVAANSYFKKTLDRDGEPKSKATDV